MCGICGLFCPNGGPVDARRVERMRDAMIARGPDGAGVSQGPGYALGHRRLAILDLSETGSQPMTNEDGVIEVTFNGEIYNFTVLRSELEASGHIFRSRSDTEVLIHGYEEWGLERLLKRIRGMYAFGLVDVRRGQIHLARDPLGKKPLFFSWDGNELAFASSARALVRGLHGRPEIDPTAVDDLLRHLYVAGAHSIFMGVEKLLPGHAVSLGRDGRRRDLVHWQPDFSQPEQGVEEAEWLARIEAALTAAIQRRLVADVPVGILLSGGVDSGLVTALAAQAAGRVKTYCVATQDPRLNESRYAQAVAERYDTEHHVLPVCSDVREDLPALVASMGEPLGDSSAANLFAISRMARRSVTVALTGDGGDECFGGYNYFLAYHYAGMCQPFLPGPLRMTFAAAAEGMRRMSGPMRKAGTLLRIASAPIEKTYHQTSPVLDAPTRAALYTPGFAARLEGYDPAAHHLRTLAGANGRLPVDRVMQAHWQTILADEFLVKTDVATMAASLEARCPFLDLDLVELAMRIPARVRFAGNEPKGLLRKLARHHVPVETVDRPKQGFATPTGRWLRDWPDLIEDLVLGSQVERRGWFRRPVLERIALGEVGGPGRDKLLWMLIVLELWLRMTADGAL
jgi:asparagine synthase (glutamine-hydrolysing)